MTAHTPIQWKATTLNGSHEVRYDGPDHAWHVADVFGGNGLTRPTKHGSAQANADFILLACNAHDDLLTACEQLLKAYRLARPQVFGTDEHEMMARAAIALATGKAVPV